MNTFTHGISYHMVKYHEHTGYFVGVRIQIVQSHFI